MFNKMIIVSVFLILGCKTDKQPQIQSETKFTDSVVATSTQNAPSKEQETSVDLINLIPNISSFPLHFNDSLFLLIDSTKALTEAQLKLFRIHELPNYQRNAQYIPYKKFQPDSVTFAVIMLQKAENFRAANLIIYSANGVLKDFESLYLKKSDSLHLKSSLISKTILQMQTKAILDTLDLAEGCLVQRTQAKSDTLIHIDSFEVKAIKSKRFQRHYDLSLANSASDRTVPINNMKLLSALWPDTTESWRLDTANHKTYVLNHFHVSESVSAIAVLYHGGCLQLWVMTLVKNQLIDRLLASETCASDAEDYSNGLFISNTVFENTKTWYQEYTEEGEDPSKMEITRYTIDHNGRVN